MMDDFENMSEFSPFTWQPVYADGSGEVIDFNSAIESQSQFSTSRGMLETIVEETSDDEDNGPYSGQWTGSDSFSSGSSETGSVVRVDAAGGKQKELIFCLPLRLINQSIIKFNVSLFFRP